MGEVRKNEAKRATFILMRNASAGPVPINELGGK
jgi:hypothetical protein